RLRSAPSTPPMISRLPSPFCSVTTRVPAPMSARELSAAARVSVDLVNISTRSTGPIWPGSSVACMAMRSSVPGLWRIRPARPSAEVGYDLKRLGVRRPLLVTDHGLTRTGLPDKVCHVLREAGLAADLYDDVHIEPTDASWQAIADFVQGRDYDGFLAVGGGSA